MPAPARKTAAKKTALEAAKAEALADGAVKMTFRGADFVIPMEVRSDFRVGLALTARLYYQAIVDLLPQPKEQVRLLSLIRRGEEPMDVMNEFFDAYSEATGEGNSSPS